MDLNLINSFTDVDIDSEICKKSLFEFVKAFWYEIIPDDPVYNWHIEYLCKELEEYAFRVKNRLPNEKDCIINIPPGTSKSTICTVMFPAWLWTNDPSLRILTASYSKSLSTDHAVKSRDIIRSDKYRLYFPEISIKNDQDNKTHYKNNSGGERYATSVGGTVTGFHAHIIIVDDPLNPKGAASDAERDTANNWMDATLSTRKVNKKVTPTILIMQRLHYKDCTGNWLEKVKGSGKEIHHICLPAELSKNVKPESLKLKYVNGLLDAVRMDKDVLDQNKIDLGSYGYSGQMQQEPTPDGGGIWEAWIIPIDDDKIPKNLENFGFDWDLAYTENEKNSACSYIESGKYDNKMYITGLDFKWLEFPDLINWMKSKNGNHYIEAKASGKSAKQSLVKLGVNAIEVKVDGGDKIARTKLATPYAESKRVYCARSIIDKLYNDDRQGILKFPNAEHNDLNDALVQAIIRLLAKKKKFVL